ncbi:hypothetical protein LJC72_01390 [Bacteroides sp. OttesenSCG-928-D19]|nr:hypothetical protein [Bacteroides sp. OttesenSCG-928-N06]MDL2303980.1 hypothetical protein [Bacteroides sp. OttesenSCG-928-D19]
MKKYDLSQFEERWNSEKGEEEYYYDTNDEWLTKDELIETLDELGYWEEWADDIYGQHE